jgi:hypothetical protein
MNFGNYLGLVGVVLIGAAALYQVGVLVRRRNVGMCHPADWSPQQVAAWARRRRVLGFVVAAVWIWMSAAFCLGLALGSPGVPLRAWASPLSMTLMLTVAWLNMVVPTYDPSRLTQWQRKWNRVLIVVVAIVGFILPVAVIGDAYCAPPWGSNVSAPLR